MPKKRLEHAGKYPHFAAGSLNNRMAANQLGPGEAQTAQNTSLLDGAIRGIYGLGTATVATVAAGSKFIKRLRDGTTWIADSTSQWAMDDGQNVYYTSATGPMVRQLAGAAVTLGINPAIAVTAVPAAVLSGGLTGHEAYHYYVTVKTSDGLQSNPIASAAVNTSTYDPSAENMKVTLSWVWPADTRITEIDIWRTGATNHFSDPLSSSGVAAAATAALNSTHYLLTTITSRSVTSVVDDGSLQSDATLLTQDQLTWEAGGYVGNTGQYTEDHSPALNLAVLADRIHSMNSGQQAAGSGVILGIAPYTPPGSATAKNNQIVWCTAGYPQYWPVDNSDALDHEILAIINHGLVSVAFGTGGTYLISGSSDTDLTIPRADAFHFIAAGAGKSAKRVPQGTIYLSREGLAFFGGSRSELLGQAKISAAFWASLSIVDSAYYDNFYYLFHTTGCVVVDLTDGVENARFGTLVFPGGYVAQAVSTEDDGIYVLLNDATGQIHLLGAGGRLAWKWRTGEVRGDTISTYNDADVLRIDYEGDVTFELVAEGGSATAATASIGGVTYTAQVGANGNQISVDQTNPGTISAQLSAFVSGDSVTTSLATADGGTQSNLAYAIGVDGVKSSVTEATNGTIYSCSGADKNIYQTPVGGPASLWLTSTKVATYVMAVKYDPTSGNLYYTGDGGSSGILVSVDIATKAETTVASAGAILLEEMDIAKNAAGITDGTIYVTDGSASLFAVAPGPGYAVTTVSNALTLSNWGCTVAINPKNGHIYVQGQSSKLIYELYGGTTKTVSTGTVQPGSLACDTYGNFYAALPGKIWFFEYAAGWLPAAPTASWILSEVDGTRQGVTWSGRLSALIYGNSLSTTPYVVIGAASIVSTNADVAAAVNALSGLPYGLQASTTSPDTMAVAASSTKLTGGTGVQDASITSITLSSAERTQNRIRLPLVLAKRLAFEFDGGDGTGTSGVPAAVYSADIEVFEEPGR